MGLAEPVTDPKCRHDVFARMYAYGMFGGSAVRRGARMNQLRVNQTNETELFFRQWLRSPKSMGAVIPSSRVLARAVTEAARWAPGQTVIELGAGTGAISQGLIDAGLPPEALMMIELDRPLFEYLRQRFPAVRVVNGDATRLVDIVRQQGITQVSTVISGLPMVTMPLGFQRAIIEQSLELLGTDGCLLQYSYSPVPPIPARKLGVEAKLVKFVMRNVPPATLWRFQPRRSTRVQANGHG
jgi:phosphatidylethanolamine/phosphatidyl-N-methylethanolamine N-methyltransferase